MKVKGLMDTSCIVLVISWAEEYRKYEYTWFCNSIIGWSNLKQNTSQAFCAFYSV